MKSLSWSIVCITSLACIVACRSSQSHGPGAQLVPNPQDPLETIARYEDARTDGDGLLQTLLQRGDPKTRERAAIALGRLDPADYGEAVTRGLVAALDDDSSAVRAAAAFALGQRGDVSAAPAILAHWRDTDSLVRARLVEAASLIDAPSMRAAVVQALDDPDASVMNEAVLGIARFKKDLPDTEVTDATLVALLERTNDKDARWRGLFALARRKAERGRALFLAGTKSDDVRARIFALQGLGGLSRDDESSRAMRSALTDRDWRVACEAAKALKSVPDPDALPALAHALEHSCAHVRRAAYEALGMLPDEKSRIASLLEHARVDTSANVRAAAIEAEARLFSADAAPKLELAALEKDPVIRGGAAAAAAHLPSEIAVPMLDRFSRDPNLRVAGIAIEGLGKHATPDSRARLWELLRANDNGLRLDAVTALGVTPVADDLPHLKECLDATTGEMASELHAEVMKNAASIGGDGALALLRRGCEDADPFVRRKSRELFVKTFPSVTPPRARPADVRATAVAIPGKDTPAWSENPRVEVRTSRGTLTFELFPDETPAHVHNFLALAAKHHYDGLSFHRVELDFVIQGGDVRGDGNGGTTWRGEPLRQEFTPRKYVRGSLGMPRNEDRDSGGSQIFVTHRETPHLDGRYTIFGELREGFDVLDQIEVGDTILDVRLLNPDAGHIERVP